MELRDYQTRAVAAVREYIRRGDGVAPVVAMPTGSGKSAVIACIAARSVALGRRVAILSHRKELLAQDAGTLVRVDPSLDGQVSIYSAGLGSKRLDGAVLVGGVQSLARAHELPQVDVVLVDEAHLVPPRAGDGSVPSQYEKVLGRLRARWMVGLTATPFRDDGGWLWERLDGKPRPWFDGCAVDVGMLELVEAGWLAPLRVVETEGGMDATRLKLSRGEYTAASQVVELTGAVLNRIVEQIVQVAEDRDRRHVMVFTPAIKVARAVESILAARLRARGHAKPAIAVVHSKMASRERDAAIAAFRDGRARWIVNCGILTTGFDAPFTDAIAYVRCSASAALWVQTLGRGSRTAPGKADCLVLDFGANADRLGTADDPIVKQPDGKRSFPVVCKPPDGCGATNRPGAQTCSGCGRFLGDPEHDPQPRVYRVAPVAGRSAVMGGSGTWYDLHHASVRVLPRPSRRGWPQLVVTMRVSGTGGARHVSVFVQLPKGPDRGRTFAGRVFRALTGRRVSDGDPETDARLLSRTLANTSRVELTRRGDYWNVVAVRRGGRPYQESGSPWSSVAAAAG